MASVLPEAKQGVVEIRHVKVSKEDAQLSALRGAFSYGGPRMGVRSGTYAHLLVHGQLMMSDTHEEARSNREFAHQAQGDVLVAGLGLGLVLRYVLAKPGVQTVAVLEKYQDVIDLVEAPLRAALPEDQAAKLTVVCADAFEWKLPKGRKWDVIYFDIWPNANIPLEESTRLKRKFARRKQGVSWMGSWSEARTRALQRREARGGRRLCW